MAAKTGKRGKKNTVIIEPEEELEEDELEEEAAQEALEGEARERDLAAILESLGGSSIKNILLKVYRKDPKNSKREWVTNARPEDLPLESMIQAEFGGGLYEIDIYTPDPHGGSSKKAVVPMPLAARRDPPPGGPAQSFDIERLITKMGEQQAAAIRQVTEMLTLKVENMVLKSGGGQGMGGKDMLEMFALFQKLMPQSKSQTLPEMLTEFAQLKELGLFGGDNGKTGWDALLEGVKTLADTAKATAARAVPARLAAPGAQQESDIETESPAGDTAGLEGADMFTMILRAHLQELCKKAADDRNPAVYAQVAADEVPEAYYGKLLEFLGSDDAQAVANLAKVCPEVGSYQPWFMEFCAELRAEIELVADPAPPANLTTAAPGAITGETVKSSTAPNAATDAASGAGNPSDTPINP